MMHVLIICWIACFLIGVAMIFKGPPPKKKSNQVQIRPQQQQQQSPPTLRYLTGASDLYGPAHSSSSNHIYSNGGNVQSNYGHDYSVEEYNTKSSKEIITESQIEFTLPERKSREFTMKQMIFSKQFILMYVMNAMSIMTGFFAVNNFKTYGQANGLNSD